MCKSCDTFVVGTTYPLRGTIECGNCKYTLQGEGQICQYVGLVEGYHMFEFIVPTQCPSCGVPFLNFGHACTDWSDKTGRRHSEPVEVINDLKMKQHEQDYGPTIDAIFLRYEKKVKFLSAMDWILGVRASHVEPSD